MHCSFKRFILLSVFISSIAIQSFASSTETFGEIVGFSVAKGVTRDSIVFPSPCEFSDDLSLEVKRQIREFVEEKMNEIPPHEFFSVDRFSKSESENQDKKLIENWSLWYFGKSLVSKLGGCSARKELETMLESKKEFYENIAFMISDNQMGLAAKEFYRKQLEVVNQLPTE